MLKKLSGQATKSKLPCSFTTYGFLLEVVLNGQNVYSIIHSIIHSEPVMFHAEKESFKDH